MEDKVKKLIDSEGLSFEWGLLFAEKLDEYKGLEAAYRTGESPILGKTFADIMARVSQNREEYINNLPLFELASRGAFFELIVQNNRRLLEMIADLVSGHEQRKHEQSGKT